MHALNHPHPGTTIRDTVVAPLRLSAHNAAEKLGVSLASLTPVLNGRAEITVELARCLEKAGFSTANFWMALQNEYDARKAERNDFGALKKNTQNDHTV